MMTGDGLLELRRRTTLVPGVLIRGELAIGAQLRAAKLVCGRSVWILTMMRAIAARPIRNSSDPRSRAREAEFCLGLLEYARISPKQRDKLDVTCARLKSAKIKSRTDLLGKYRHRRRKRPTRY